MIARSHRTVSWRASFKSRIAYPLLTETYIFSPIGRPIRDTRRDIRQGNEAQNKDLAYAQAESLRVGATVASTGRSMDATTTMGKADVGNQETTIGGQLEVCAFIF